MEPIEFRAIQNLQTTILGINVAGGYFYDVAAAAVKLDPDHKVEDLVAPNGPRPFSLIEVFTGGGSEGQEKWEYTGGGEALIKIPALVHWVSDSVPTDDSSRLQVFLRGCADVEQAIGANVTLGGLVTDTRITSRSFDRQTRPHVWAFVGVEISIRRQFGRPNG